MEIDHRLYQLLEAVEEERKKKSVFSGANVREVTS